MPSADQVPTNNSHSRMLWHMWVVLIAGSTGSALRAVRPPNLHITPVVRRDFVYRASATGSLYRSPLAIIAQTIRTILLASTIAATLVGRRPGKLTWRCLNRLSLSSAWLAPLNRGSLNRAHIHGTDVPVEEPSTASDAEVIEEISRRARGPRGGVRKMPVGCIARSGANEGGRQLRCAQRVTGKAKSRGR